MENQVTLQEFESNPLAIIQNPHLMISLGGKFYPYDNIMQAYLISTLCFKRKSPSIDVFHERAAFQNTLKLETNTIITSGSGGTVDTESPMSYSQGNGASSHGPNTPDIDISNEIPSNTSTRWFNWFSRTQSTNPLQEEHDLYQRMEFNSGKILHITLACIITLLNLLKSCQ